MFDDKIQEVVDAFDMKDTIYQRVAPIATEIIEQGGYSALAEFAKQATETRGKEVPLTTLFKYAWMYKRLRDLPVPEDLPHSVLEKIAAIKAKSIRRKFVDKINREKLTAQDVKYLLKYK